MFAPRRRARRSGFTLVELMTVVAIVALMGAIAMATMGGVGNGQNPAALARSLQFAMMGARTAALSDGFQHRLECVAQTVNSYCLVEKAGQAGMGAPTSWTQEARINAGSHAIIWNITAQTDVGPQTPTQVTGVSEYVTFYPDGSADPTGKTIYVADSAGTNTANHYKVYVYSATAMARLVNQW
jgi:prepilin-type N-terminal cleavage/methylation domain-containing protein